LATTDDARVHCAVLKIRAVPDLHRHVARESRSDRGNQPSGRSLRTQQRARPVQPLGSGVPCRGARGHQVAVLTSPGSCPDRITSAPLVSCHPETFARDMALDASGCSPQAPGAP
jgi:hypothetical protein